MSWQVKDIESYEYLICAFGYVRFTVSKCSHQTSFNSDDYWEATIEIDGGDCKRIASGKTKDSVMDACANYLKREVISLLNSAFYLVQNTEIEQRKAAL